MSHRYSITTLDPRVTWWCRHCRLWGGGDDLECWRHWRGSHRGVRTLRQALTHAAVLVLRGVVDVSVSGRGREWLLSTTVPGDGVDAAASITWARRYLALPRRKR